MCSTYGGELAGDWNGQSEGQGIARAGQDKIYSTQILAEQVYTTMAEQKYNRKHLCSIACS